MNILRGLKQFVGKRMLAREIEPVRIKQGSNFSTAQRVAIIYQDSDEDFFKRIKQYATFLKNTYSIKSVNILGFVDKRPNQIPVWQQHVLESDFFSREDLNWYLRPTKRTANFTVEDYDILIDFSGGEKLPLNFVLKESKAHMKVGIKGSQAEKYCDFIIDMGDKFGIAQFVEQLNLYLSNPKIK